MSNGEVRPPPDVRLNIGRLTALYQDIKELDRKEEKVAINLAPISPLIACPLCSGYLVNATAITECLHVFCRSCLIKYLQVNANPFRKLLHSRTEQAWEKQQKNFPRFLQNSHILENQYFLTGDIKIHLVNLDLVLYLTKPLGLFSLHSPNHLVRFGLPCFHKNSEFGPLQNPCQSSLYFNLYYLIIVNKYQCNLILLDDPRMPRVRRKSDRLRRGCAKVRPDPPRLGPFTRPARSPDGIEARARV